ncbi:hypothetical protein DIPPA_32304 [Diplonema papillatum]|nr:hypothetical protein DIPPA_15360 [Diplonema papillatum]KAJ9449874.1 hypothetical protein DIPPA_32304 [Diplonema papillatum]
MMYRPDDNVSTSGDTVFGTSLLDVLKQHLPDVCVDQVESDLRARYVSVSFVEAVLGAVARKDNTLFSLFTAARPPPLRSYADFDKWWAYWAPFDRLSILEFDECARGSLQKEAGFVRHKHGARTVYRRADFTRSNWMELVLFEGCYVKLTIAQGARPALGWGELNPARPTPRVGCVRKKRTRTHHGRVVFKVEFPEQRAFHALADELSPASEVDVLSTRA